MALLVAVSAWGALLFPVPSAAAEGAPVPAKLVWRSCGRPVQCTKLRVPLDYRSRAGASIDLAVARVRARDTGDRIGSLVVNPGGPGASGISYLRGIVDLLPGELRDRFDLVSFDPRGVGESDPVECSVDIDPLFDQSFSPATPEQRAGLVNQFQHVVDACGRANGDLLRHVSTLDTARDLDALRAALGDRKLSFVGESYGTYLGTLYATRFPTRVRAIVLDGAIDPDADATDVALGQARGFEQGLDAFLRDCARERACAFHHGGHAARAYDDLRARAARVPLATRENGGRVVNETRFDAAVLEALYAGTAGWRSLGQALEAAEHGDASTLLGMADSLVGRGSGGNEHTALDAYWAITCLDGPPVGDLAAAEHLEAQAVGVAPRLGAFLVNLTLSCSLWPVPTEPRPGSLRAAGTPPILVIGTTNDPATPLASARALARELDHGVLLVAGGYQHGSFVADNTCVDHAVTRYLVTLDAPRSGTRC